MAINARLDLELDRVAGAFGVADTSTRLYVYDSDISLSVSGWTRDEVAIGQDGKTMYEPYLQIVYGGMVLAEAKLNGVEDPPEDEEDYSMTGTLNTNTVQMAAMFCGCVASETMRQFEARIFSTTSANPIATGRVSVWSFPSGGANPVNLPSASEVLAALRTDLNNHVENEDIHVTAQEKTAWTGKQDALTFDNAPTEGSQNPVKSGGIKTALGAEAQARAQGDTALGNAISAEADIRHAADNELGEDIAEERNRAEGEENRIQGDLNTHKENLTIHVTATDKAAWNAKVNPATLLGYVNGGAYDSESRRILFKHDNTTIAWIDATPFIVDGMVDSAYITPDGAYLVITFNTDSGKQPINIPLTNIFDPANYYDKDAVDRLLAGKAEVLWLHKGDGADVGVYDDEGNSYTSDEIRAKSLSGYIVLYKRNNIVFYYAYYDNGYALFFAFDGSEGSSTGPVGLRRVSVDEYGGLSAEEYEHIPSSSTASPAMDGTASAGTSAAYARGDHVHPTDTSRMAATATGADIPLAGGDETIYDVMLTKADDIVEVDGQTMPLSDGIVEVNTKIVQHADDTTIHVTSTEKSTWNGKQNALTQTQLDNIAAVPSKANVADLPYSQTATTGGAFIVLSARSGNRYDLSAVTGAVVVALPTVESGKCADVVCTIVTGVTVPTLSFPSGVVFIAADSAWQTLAASSYNVFSFTSTGAPNEWIVGRITSALPTA